MKIKLIKNLDVANKTVLLRTDFNVVLEGGKIREDYRIKTALPTIEYLINKRAKIVLVSHMGRPQKKGQSWSSELGLMPAAKKMADLLGRKFIEIDSPDKRLPEYDIPHVFFYPHNIEENDVKPKINEMKPGDIMALENLRFYKGEEENDPAFAKLLASLASCYVNDAFAASHREHASVCAITEFLPGAAGLGLEKEIHMLGKVLNHPKKPMVVMLGGVKLETKAPTIVYLAEKGDAILAGGGIANLLLSAKGFEIGKSVGSESGQSRVAREIIRNFKDKIILPIDLVVSTEMDGRPEVVSIEKVRPYQYILDIGPATINLFSQHLRRGKTLVWNGPMGYFEQKQFLHGTFALARFFASRTKSAAFGVAGGGETLEIISRENLAPYIDHVSTGGGAMLEFLAGKPLPGIAALEEGN